jgi:nucleotide-binding universal stress UspA family protein
MVATIERLLLAIGPNDREHVGTLVDEALAVAGPTGAAVYLLHVFPREEYEELLGQMEIEPGSSSIPPDELALRHENLRSPADRLDDAGVDYEVRGVVGDPDTEIVRVADDLDVDRIVIGGTGRSPAGKAVFGDHAQQVLLNAACPVTYVRRD